MSYTITNERIFRKVHTFLGYLVIINTLVTLVMRLMTGRYISFTNIVFAILIVIVGWFIKHLNEPYLKDIKKYQEFGLEKLVTLSLYGRVRNPSDLANVLLVFGFMLVYPSVSSFGLFLIYFGFVNLTIFIEENRLRTKFERQYQIYETKVGRWTPQPLSTIVTGKYKEIKH